MNIKRFIDELKRRNIFRVATAYVIAGWLIIQVIATIAPQLNLPPWVPSFVTIVVLCGFPLALVFAWAFELTPEGIKKSKEVEISQSVTHKTGKKLNKLIITVLSITIVFLLIERIFFASSTAYENTELADVSIAVLPFVDLSNTGDQEYFSDGLSEELLNVLAKVNDLKVAGRTSSFKFKGQNDDLKKIGVELGVNHILEGSVRKSGNQIRITAQLIKVEDGFHMWSETYDREYSANNLFEIQDEISQKVLDELKIRLLDDEVEEVVNRPTENLEAYELLLKGNELIRNRKAEEIIEAIEKFREAVNLDPDFARAHARIAIGYTLLREYGSIKRDAASDSIRKYADNALLLDSELPEAYVGLGNYYREINNRDKYMEALKKAYDLDSNNPDIINWYANSIPTFLDGKEIPENYKKRLELRKIAYEIDPLSPVILSNLILGFQQLEDYDNALKYADIHIEKFPEAASGINRKVIILSNEPFGQLDEAFKVAYEAYKAKPDRLEFINGLFHMASTFDLLFIMEETLVIMKELYPDNEDTFYAELTVLDAKGHEDEANQKDFEYQKNLIKEEEKEEWLLYIDLEKNIGNSNYKAAIDLLKEKRPLLFSDTLTVHPYDYFLSSKAKWLLNKVGDEKQIEVLAKLPCYYGDTPLKVGEDLSKESSSTLFRLLRSCAVYNQDGQLFADIFNELYFNRKYKSMYGKRFMEDPEYDEIRKHPAVQDIFQRIIADRDLMKENIVAFLKDQGAWQEEGGQ